ncbi:helix-turn-helix domain-containing protein [bacterium]|nr:helix-turn-helix domain-containing protein [bacterium]
MEFGEFLRHLRKEKQLTLRDVEKSTGISNPYLSQIETGARKPPHPTILSKLASCYGVTPELLMEQAGYLEPKTDRKDRRNEEIEKGFDIVYHRCKGTGRMALNKIIYGDSNSLKELLIRIYELKSDEVILRFEPSANLTKQVEELWRLWQNRMEK